jgi:asparagine synthetase B (glutamine-hydrolysing)
MCGFLAYRTSGNNKYIKKRGPDTTTQFEYHGFTFVHNLLSITGAFTPQPFIDNEIICLFNGEIYNQTYVKSDGENIIPLYKKYGTDFPKYLDGEWAIALYDFGKNLAVFSTDLFATKPLWRNGLECASYESGVGGKKIKANTIEIIHFNGRKETKEIYAWDFVQHKETYDDWIDAFSKAVKKRATNNCFIGLSSGYDSGALACELQKQHIDFKSYIIQGKEDINVLDERMKKVKNYQYYDKETNFRSEKKWIDTNIEKFSYHISTKKDLHHDSASVGLSKICRDARAEKRYVYLSGQGSDEILSDYALFPYQSTFKGEFPQKLFIWENFYDGCQYSYLGKEEYVAGSHGIEARYPFLDKNVVQEFLWLTCDLKNKNYKAPLYEYLTRNKFPFLQNTKIGLSHLL